MGKVLRELAVAACFSIIYMGLDLLVRRSRKTKPRTGKTATHVREAIGLRLLRAAQDINNGTQ